MDGKPIGLTHYTKEQWDAMDAEDKLAEKKTVIGIKPMDADEFLEALESAFKEHPNEIRALIQAILGSA